MTKKYHHAPLISIWNNQNNNTTSLVKIIEYILSIEYTMRIPIALHLSMDTITQLTSTQKKLLKTLIAENTISIIPSSYHQNKFIHSILSPHEIIQEIQQCKQNHISLYENHEHEELQILNIFAPLWSVWHHKDINKIYLTHYNSYIKGICSTPKNKNMFIYVVMRSSTLLIPYVYWLTDQSITTNTASSDKSQSNLYETSLKNLNQDNIIHHIIYNDDDLYKFYTLYNYLQQIQQLKKHTISLDINTFASAGTYQTHKYYLTPLCNPLQRNTTQWHGKIYPITQTADSIAPITESSYEDFGNSIMLGSMHENVEISANNMHINFARGRITSIRKQKRMIFRTFNSFSYLNLIQENGVNEHLSFYPNVAFSITDEYASGLYTHTKITHPSFITDGSLTNYYLFVRNYPYPLTCFSVQYPQIPENNILAAWYPLIFTLKLKQNEQSIALETKIDQHTIHSHITPIIFTKNFFNQQYSITHNALGLQTLFKIHENNLGIQTISAFGRKNPISPINYYLHKKGTKRTLNIGLGKCLHDISSIELSAITSSDAHAYVLFPGISKLSDIPEIPHHVYYEVQRILQLNANAIV